MSALQWKPDESGGYEADVAGVLWLAISADDFRCWWGVGLQSGGQLSGETAGCATTVEAAKRAAVKCADRILNEALAALWERTGGETPGGERG